MTFSDAGSGSAEFKETILPVYRVTGDNDKNEDVVESDSDEDVKVMGDPYFISVHQLVDVMEYDTAILECAVTNIDSSITVSLMNVDFVRLTHL